MKAIFIDSHRRIVEEFNISNVLEDCYNLIVCQCITSAFMLPNRDTCFVDDEGLLKTQDSFFMYRGMHQPFAGNGVIIGGNEEGESIDVKTSLKEVREKVKFLNVFEIRAAYNSAQ